LFPQDAALSLTVKDLSNCQKDTQPISCGTWSRTETKHIKPHWLLFSYTNFLSVESAKEIVQKHSPDLASTMNIFSDRAGTETLKFTMALPHAYT
jgi:hypothetical protein